MNIGFIKTGTNKPTKDKQKKKLEDFKIEKWFVASPGDNNKHLESMLSFARSGDTCYVTDLSALASTLIKLSEVFDVIEEKNIRLVSVKENFDTGDIKKGYLKKITDVIVSFEYSNRKIRQLEGIELAKQKGLYKGRQPVKIEKEHFDECYREYMTRKINKGKFADKLGVSRPTADKLLAAYNNGSILVEDGKYYIDTRKGANDDQN